VATELSYNGVVWTSLYTTKVSSHPVQDDAGRTTVAVEHTLEVSGYIAGGTDSTLTDLRKLLSAQGGELRYNDHGFGTLHVNGNSNVRDARWGPKTEVVDFRPLGGNGQAAQVTWRCVVVIPECDGALYQKGIMALNYDVRYSIDGDGYTSVAIAGYLEIPATRLAADSRVVPDVADRYRERLEGRTVPLGFKREQQQYNLSADRRRLDFSWVDRQQPMPLPRRVTKISMTQTVRSQGLAQGKLWTVTFAAAITMAAGVSQAEALGVFLGIVNSRITKERAALWTALEVTEDVFGNVARFSVTIRHTATRPLELILADYRMWMPYQHATWAGWRESMYATRVFTSRGNAGLKYEPGEDAIIDLCDTAKPMVAGPQPEPKTPSAPKGQGRGEGEKPKRAPADSWLDFQSWIRWFERANVVVHKPLPPSPVQPSPTPQPGRGGSLRPFDTPPATGESGGNTASSNALRPFPESRQLAVTPSGTGPAAPLDTPAVPGANEGRSAVFPADIVQKAASATRRAQLFGRAIRASYRIAPPKLVSIGGSAVVEESRDVHECVLGCIGDEPIYCTMWSIVYLVPEAPLRPFEVAANPMLDVDGGS
jgi:hypothetical protein